MYIQYGYGFCSFCKLHLLVQIRKIHSLVCVATTPRVDGHRSVTIPSLLCYLVKNLPHDSLPDLNF